MPAAMISNARAMRLPVVVGAQPSHRSRSPYQKARGSIGAWRGVDAVASPAAMTP